MKFLNVQFDAVSSKGKKVSESINKIMVDDKTAATINSEQTIKDLKQYLKYYLSALGLVEIIDITKTEIEDMK